MPGFQNPLLNPPNLGQFIAPQAGLSAPQAPAVPGAGLASNNFGGLAQMALTDAPGVSARLAPHVAVQPGVVDQMLQSAPGAGLSAGLPGLAGGPKSIGSIATALPQGGNVGGTPPGMDIATALGLAGQGLEAATAGQQQQQNISPPRAIAPRPGNAAGLDPALQALILQMLSGTAGAGQPGALNLGALIRGA